MKKTLPVLFWSITLLLLSNPSVAQSDNCYLKEPYWENVSGSYYPTFERTSCRRNVTIYYKVYFADGTSDQSRFEYIMASSYSTKVHGIAYRQPGRIEILRREWGDEDDEETSASSSSGSHSSDNDFSSSVVRGLGSDISIGDNYSYVGIGIGYGISYGGYGAKLFSRLSDNIMVIGLSAGFGYSPVTDGSKTAWTVGGQIYLYNLYVDVQYGKRNYTGTDDKGVTFLLGYNLLTNAKFGLNLAFGGTNNLSLGDHLGFEHFVWEVGLVYAF
jgi:hypothetical protein